MYLDHNATSPMTESVAQAVSLAMRNDWANPSSPHSMGQAAFAKVEYSRIRVADELGVPSKWVYFTSGATEGNAWALSTSTHPVVCSAVEHPSVLSWAQDIIPVDSRGLIDLEALDRHLATTPALVSVMAANNETGVRQPIDEVFEICRQRSCLLHCDATQVFGRGRCDFSADYITVSAHKFGGPRGIGALISKTPPKSILQGGKQERGARSGTLNTPAIIGFGAALEEQRSWPAEERDKLEHFCLKQGGRILGGGAPRLTNTLSVLFDVPGDLLVTALDLAGIQASTGSACASGANTDSHVLRAMGIEGVPVRFSFGPDSKAEPAIAALDRIFDQKGDQCVS